MSQAPSSLQNRPSTPEQQVCSKYFKQAKVDKATMPDVPKPNKIRWSSQTQSVVGITKENAGQTKKRKGEIINTTRAVKQTKTASNSSPAMDVSSMQTVLEGENTPKAKPTRGPQTPKAKSTTKKNSKTRTTPGTPRTTIPIIPPEIPRLDDVVEKAVSPTTQSSPFTPTPSATTRAKKQKTFSKKANNRTTKSVVKAHDEQSTLDFILASRNTPTKPSTPYGRAFVPGISSERQEAQANVKLHGPTSPTPMSKDDENIDVDLWIKMYLTPSKQTQPSTLTSSPPKASSLSEHARSRSPTITPPSRLSPAYQAQPKSGTLQSPQPKSPNIGEVIRSSQGEAFDKWIESNDWRSSLDEIPTWKLGEEIGNINSWKEGLQEIEEYFPNAPVTETVVEEHASPDFVHDIFTPRGMEKGAAHKDKTDQHRLHVEASVLAAQTRLQGKTQQIKAVTMEIHEQDADMELVLKQGKEIIFPTTQQDNLPQSPITGGEHEEWFRNQDMNANYGSDSDLSDMDSDELQELAQDHEPSTPSTGTQQHGIKIATNREPSTLSAATQQKGIKDKKEIESDEESLDIVVFA